MEYIKGRNCTRFAVSMIFGYTNAWISKYLEGSFTTSLTHKVILNMMKKFKHYRSDASRRTVSNEIEVYGLLFNMTLFHFSRNAMQSRQLKLWRNMNLKWEKLFVLTRMAFKSSVPRKSFPETFAKSQVFKLSNLLYFFLEKIHLYLVRYLF